jgi:hypothetical protein
VRKYEKSRFPERWSDIHIRLKGRLKNEFIDYAREKGISVNELILFATREFIKAEKNIPPAGSAQFSIPTTEEVVAAYVRGETILQPCGQKECDQKVTYMDSMEFCDTCNLRIR